MTLYRKRPIEVEMVQWAGDNFDEVSAFAPVMMIVLPNGWLAFHCEKSASDVHILAGGWIAADADGGFYPISEAEQAATYDKVDPEADARALYERSSLYCELNQGWDEMAEEHREHFRARIAEESGR